jgi:hypothetical protein
LLIDTDNEIKARLWTLLARSNVCPSEVSLHTTALLLPQQRLFVTVELWFVLERFACTCIDMHCFASGCGFIAGLRAGIKLLLATECERGVDL